MTAISDEQAKEIASKLTGNSDYLDPDVRGTARSLKALLPSLGSPWAVVELQPITDGSTHRRLLSLVSEDGVTNSLWTAYISSAEDPKYEWPSLMVERFGSLQWGIATISDTFHWNGGNEAVLRAYLLVIGDERFVFRTDEIVGSPASRIEQFGRDLAVADNWPISGVEAENP